MLRIRIANVADFSKVRNDRTAIVLYEEQHAQAATPTASIRPSNAGRRGDGAAFLLCHSMGHGPNTRFWFQVQDLGLTDEAFESLLLLASSAFAAPSICILHLKTSMPLSR
jgi:hypothetical protein